ncbi:MAG: low molecular weight protein-tyrosine-phosphatase [Gemmatimonadota bacterium]
MSARPDKLSVLFVCLGNICRSPLAEGVFRHFVRESGLEQRFHIDSAGTSSYHTGDPPDQRTCAVARARGIELRGASRQIGPDDLDRFDYVITMDEENRSAVQRLARKSTGRATLHRLREFDPATNGDLDVPDPYYGGARGFEQVQDMVERSCRALLEHLRAQHDL